MAKYTPLLVFLLLTSAAAAFQPLVGTPLADREHPRIHITEDNLPAIRQAISDDPVLRDKYQEYVEWAKDQDIDSKDNTISTAGHVVLHPQMIDQALIAQIGEVDGVSFPSGWTSQDYADVAIDTLKTRLSQGSDIAYAAAITYDWTYDFMTEADRQEIAEMMVSADITHKVFDITVSDPHIDHPRQMFSSKYYETTSPYYIGLVLWGDGHVDADEAVDTFYDQMLNYGYFDAMHLTGIEGGWNEWTGYSSWHPKNHLLNIDAWRTATGENYITGDNVRVSAEVELGQEAEYARFMHYAIDPHHYVAEPDHPLELDAYTFIKSGSSSTTDTSLDHNEKRQELWYLSGMLYDMGLATEAGLIRDFMDRYDVEFIQYPQHWSWAFMGAQGSKDTVTPEQAGLPKYLWAKHHGSFFARTGFTSTADGVLMINDAHYRYAGHDGADDFPGFAITKFGTLVNSRYVAHRGYGNLENYPGAFRHNVIDFGVEEEYKQLNDQPELKEMMEGDPSYDLGGIEQVSVQDEIYHVSVDRSRLFDSIKHTREYVWVPGDNPISDPDTLFIYDRTAGSSSPRWIYHVPWEPEASGHSSSEDISTGTGESDRKGIRYTGEVILKELNGLGGEDDADEHNRGTSYTGGAGAHGVLFAKTLLPEAETEVTRVARLDDDVLHRQDNLAIKAHRWQVAVIPTASGSEHNFLNVLMAGEENTLTSMADTSLIGSGAFEGAFVDQHGGPDMAVLFHKEDRVYQDSLSYTVQSGDLVRHVIVGIDPTRTYEITQDGDTFQASPMSKVDLWDYIDSDVEKIGVLTFTSSGGGSFVVNPSGEAPQTCADSTIYGQCSQDKPKFCDGGVLSQDCQTCGCPADLICQEDGSCRISETCGDGICSEGEDCPEDCEPQGSCGDSVCDADEDSATCPQDCEEESACGDNVCDADEDAESCPADCDAETEVLLTEDFEGSTTHADPFIDDTDSEISSEHSMSGSRSLKMCNAQSCKFSYREELGSGSDTLYARYWFYVDDHEAWYNEDGSPKSGEHYKNPGLEGGGTECKGGDYTGDDCVTVRTRLNTPHYGVWIEGHTGNIESVDDSVNVVDGNWHCIEMQVSLNTPGQEDGFVNYWIDGHKNSITDLKFRNDYSWSLSKWWWTYWANDNWIAPTYLDDLVISTGPIGCGDAPEPTCIDEDGDGYGTEGDCPREERDCDDTDAQINPSSVDVCGNSIDENCDGSDSQCECTIGASEECDTGQYGVCSPGERSCEEGSWGLCYPLEEPREEECGNEIDDDCDGEVDEGCEGICDTDGDGYDEFFWCVGGGSNDDCNDDNAAAYPGAQEICGNNVDEDCDGEDLECSICEEGPISERCTCGDKARDALSGYCCDGSFSQTSCEDDPEEIGEPVVLKAKDVYVVSEYLPEASYHDRSTSYSGVHCNPFTDERYVVRTLADFKTKNLKNVAVDQVTDVHLVLHVKQLALNICQDESLVDTEFWIAKLDADELTWQDTHNMMKSAEKKLLGSDLIRSDGIYRFSIDKDILNWIDDGDAYLIIQNKEDLLKEHTSVKEFKSNIRLELYRGDAPSIDSDNDGLSDVVEEQLGFDPRKGDSDGDGRHDIEELRQEGLLKAQQKLTDLLEANEKACSDISCSSGEECVMGRCFDDSEADDLAEKACEQAGGEICSPCQGDKLTADDKTCCLGTC